MFLGQGEDKETARETGVLALQRPEPGRDPGSPAFPNTRWSIFAGLFCPLVVVIGNACTQWSERARLPFWVPSGFHWFIQEAVSTEHLLCAGY